MESLQSIFDVVQLEVLDLMATDSYHRFVNSTFYQKFKQNDPAPTWNTTEDESSQAASQSRKSRGTGDQDHGTELGILSSMDQKSSITLPQSSTFPSDSEGSISGSSPNKPLLENTSFDVPSPAKSISTPHTLSTIREFTFPERTDVVKLEDYPRNSKTTGETWTA